MGLLMIAAGLVGAKMVTSAVSNVSVTIMENRAERKKLQPLMENNHQPVTPKKLTDRCCSCRAPISGFTNTFIKCQYCDTEQVLNQKERH